MVGVLAGEVEGNNYLQDLSVDGTIILKGININKIKVYRWN